MEVMSLAASATPCSTASSRCWSCCWAEVFISVTFSESRYARLSILARFTANDSSIWLISHGLQWIAADQSLVHTRFRRSEVEPGIHTL